MTFFKRGVLRMSFIKDFNRGKNEFYPPVNIKSGAKLINSCLQIRLESRSNYIKK